MINSQDYEKIEAYLIENGCDWERVCEYMILPNQNMAIIATLIIFENFINDSRMPRWGWIYYGCEWSGLFAGLDVTHFEQMIIKSFAKATHGTGKTSQIRKSVKYVRNLMGTRSLNAQEEFEKEIANRKIAVIMEQLKSKCPQR